MSGTERFALAGPGPGAEPGDWDVPRAMAVDFTGGPTPGATSYPAESGLKGFFLQMGEASLACGHQADIQAFQAQGGTAILSIGGAGPLEARETGIPAIAAHYEALVRRHGVRHLDFHFQGRFLDEPVSQERHAAALARLRTALPALKVSYTLPAVVVPGVREGFSGAAVRFLHTLARSGAEPALVNGHAREFGPGAPPEADGCWQRALLGMHRHLAAAFPRWEARKVWRRLGACPVFGPLPEGHRLTPEHLRRLVAFAQERDLGCVVGWEAGHDRGQGFGFSRLLAALPEDVWVYPPQGPEARAGTALNDPVAHALGLLEAAAALERKTHMR
jgi:chitinase